MKTSILTQLITLFTSNQMRKDLMPALIPIRVVTKFPFEKK